MSAPTPAEVEHALAVLESAGWTIGRNEGYGVLYGSLLVQTQWPHPAEARRYEQRVASTGWTPFPVVERPRSTQDGHEYEADMYGNCDRCGYTHLETEAEANAQEREDRGGNVRPR